MRPTAHVLDMFAVPDALEPVTGGQGRSVHAGDLLLSPGREPRVQDLLSPPLARLAVELDTRPGRDHRDLRIAMPVPARDGSWVVDGWAATRHEPGSLLLTDLTATLAVGAVLHAELARAVTAWPLTDEPPIGRWAVAERVAFGEQVPALRVESVAGNVLLDPQGAPVVIDVAPYWRPALWAQAVAVLDAVMRSHAPAQVMDEWATGRRGQAMLRAAIFRLLSDRPVDPAAYASALGPLLARSAR